MTEYQAIQYKLKSIEPYIAMIRLGAEICVWCGMTVPKEKWTQNFNFNQISIGHAFWLGAPDGSWICQSPCTQSCTAHVVSLTLRALDQEFTEAKNQRK